jgi:predicted GNAT superfamily acetyltransferase
MPIVIRPIAKRDEYHAVEDLQREIWGCEEIEILPHDLLMIVHKNGGILFGAFAEETGRERLIGSERLIGRERLIGFVFGFPGFQPDGRLKHCSHVAGVIADYRDQNVGYQLKLAQRERVLAQGIDLITWTFDPLESRNARFNFHKLGAVCRTYERNLYGEMRDALNAGLPSDRFQVDWQIASERVDKCLRHVIPEMKPSELIAADVPVIDPLQVERAISDDHFLVEIPAYFQEIKAADRELARQWRLGTRAVFEEAFAQGYQVIDLLFENGRSFYLLGLKPENSR